MPVLVLTYLQLTHFKGLLLELCGRVTTNDVIKAAEQNTDSVLDVSVTDLQSFGDSYMLYI